MRLSRDEISALEKRYRTTLMNSLSGYRSVHLCGTVSKNGQANLSVINSVVHLGASPPFLGMVLRPKAANQHTLTNIVDTRWYTLNQMPAAYVQQVHQCSARYEGDEDEFEKVGLTKVYSGECLAPLVAESNVRYSLKLEEIIPIEVNGTYFIIGSVQHIEVDSALVEADGYVNLPKGEILAVNGLDAYHTATHLCRFEYAKRDKPVTILDKEQL